jgi:hypothetical protein
MIIMDITWERFFVGKSEFHQEFSWVFPGSHDQPNLAHHRRWRQWRRLCHGAVSARAGCEFWADFLLGRTVFDLCWWDIPKGLNKAWLRKLLTKQELGKLSWLNLPFHGDFSTENGEQGTEGEIYNIAEAGTG